MKRVRFSIDSGEPQWGILDGQTVYQTESLFSDGRGGGRPLDSVKLHAPCMPSKIVCVGRNYHDHAKELGNPVPAEPLIFLKPPSAIIGPGDPIVYPPISQLVSHEAELGIVIGKRARFVKAANASDYVLGYTCVNDVTARDLQKKDGQWTRGKGFDTFCPVGPWIVPYAAIEDLGSVRVRAYVNGALRQDGAVREMIFPPDVIIEFVTAFLTLEPGDLIATGTPSGVGPIEPGDAVKIEVTGVGAIENPVVKG